MNLNKTFVLGMTSLIVLGAGRLLAQVQNQPGETTSLGALARQLKAQRAKSGKKPVKVYSNDNLPARPAGGGVTVAAGMSQGPESGPGAAGGETPATGASSGAHGEKYFRERMAELRDRLEIHQRQLSVLQQKQSQGETQFYTDPNKTLQQEYSRSDINKLTDDVAKKQQEIAADEKAIEDLRDQLRREGGEPGWLR